MIDEFDTRQPFQVTQGERLRAPFPEDKLKNFVGRGRRTFTYVEDESVMDRLDDVFGVGGWSLTMQAMSDTCVKATLSIPGTSGDPCHYEDFGYPTNADGEPLKEAASDAIRRVGRMVGIARYIYAGETDAPAPPAERPVPDDGARLEAAKKALRSRARERGLDDEAVRSLSMFALQKASSKEWTAEDVRRLFTYVEDDAMVNAFEETRMAEAEGATDAG